MSDLTRYDDALALKFALEEVLGIDAWLQLKDTKSLTAWRGSLLKAIEATSVATQSTIKVCDPGWMSEANRIIERGKESIGSAKNIQDAIAGFSACYLRLSFHQLGQLPNYRGRKGRRAVPSNWVLDGVRSVQYVQSKKQILSVEFKNDPRELAEKALDRKYDLLR
jgi:hypothetical protein